MNIFYLFGTVIQIVGFILYIVSYWVEGIDVNYILYTMAAVYMLLNLYNFIDIKELCWINYVLAVPFCIFLIMAIWGLEVTIGSIIFHSIVSCIFGLFLFVTSVMYDVEGTR